MPTRRRSPSAIPSVPFRTRFPGPFPMPFSIPMPLPVSTSIPQATFSGPLFAPWRPVFANAAMVIPMRLALMPWLMLVDPAAGRREANLMVDEKKAAWNESLASLWLAPMRYWTSVATLAVAPGAAGVEKALGETSRLAAKPYGTRVRANRRRLSRGG